MTPEIQDRIDALKSILPKLGLPATGAGLEHRNTLRGAGLETILSRVQSIGHHRTLVGAEADPHNPGTANALVIRYIPVRIDKDGKQVDDKGRKPLAVVYDHTEDTDAIGVIVPAMQYISKKEQEEIAKEASRVALAKMAEEHAAKHPQVAAAAKAALAAPAEASPAIEVEASEVKTS